MANPPPPKMPTKTKKPVASWRRNVGKAIPWLLTATVGALVLQVYLGASGLLGADLYLDTHALFANAGIRLLYLLIIIVGFVGADWRVGVAGVVLMALLEVQYPLIGADAGSIRGLHAVNGVLMFAITLTMLLRRLPWVKVPVAALPTAAAPPSKPMASVRPAAPPMHTPSTPRPPTPPQR